MAEPFENMPARLLDPPYLASLMAQLDALPNPQAMNLEMLDGFFAGLICAPTLVMPSTYLPMILGDHRKAIQFEKANALPAFLALLTEHWNHIARSLSAGELFLPLLLEDEQGHATGNDWATGFMRAMQIDSQHWSGLLNDEAQGGALIPILALAYENDPDLAMRPYGDTPVSDEQREALLAGMAVGIAAIYAYFEPWRGNPSTLRRSAVETYPRTNPKIGRNDPCPCGSGRKYKLCHGQQRAPVSSPPRH